MKNLPLFPALLFIACLVAGVYGAVHNQISYTVSPEYFLEFKFHQFAIPEGQHSRIGAAMVGFYASWWMGILIGIPVLTIGLILPGWKMYLTRCLVAMGVVAATALVVGLVALLFASLFITETMLSDYKFPIGVDKVAFARAGTMHNFTYLGGFLGILTGSAYLIVVKTRMK
jgi:hypothetical protein